MMFMAGTAQADGFPDRAITLIAPFAAGGSSDALARTIARGMEDALGQPVIVQNLPGAGGTIGLTELATSAPDGYTIALGGVGSLIHSAGVYRDLIQFDVTKDIAPITLLAATPVVVVTGPGGDIETLDELLEAAKEAPGEVPFGSSGMGTAMHLTAELFQRETGTELLHIPYAGVAPAVTDLLGGQIPLGFFDVTSVLPHRENPDIHVLAVASPERAPQLPDTPTLAEGGIAVNGEIWYGLVAPAGIPETALAALESAAVAAAGTEATQSSFAQLGFYAMQPGHNEMQTVMDRDSAIWLPIISEVGITAR